MSATARAENLSATREPSNAEPSNASPSPGLGAAARASVLAEALPYIQRFAGTTVVVKYGGNAMEDPSLAALFAEDVVLMHHVGMHPVVVHGGGPQITDLMRRLGKEPTFVDGQRVTDAETADIARMALVGQVNREIVGSINSKGPYAVGLSGEDAKLIQVRPRDERLGFVGDVEAVNPSILQRLIREDLIPVVATVAVDDHGQTYNINADAVAGAIAGALRAEKLVHLTNVSGLYRDFADPGSLISKIGVGELRGWLVDGSLADGMVPKITSCVAALEAGVAGAHILDGRLPHALLLECFTEEGIGTMVVPDTPSKGVHP